MIGFLKFDLEPNGFEAYADVDLDGNLCHAFFSYNDNIVIQLSLYSFYQSYFVIEPVAQNYLWEDNILFGNNRQAFDVTNAIGLTIKNSTIEVNVIKDITHFL